MNFDVNSFDTDEVLSINLPANTFVFSGFNVHHKHWLTYSCKTDRAVELCYNISTLSDLTQLVNLPTQIHACDSQSPTVLDVSFFRH